MEFGTELQHLPNVTVTFQRSKSNFKVERFMHDLSATACFRPHLNLCARRGLVRAQSRLKNCGCPAFIPVPTNVQLQWSEASNGEEWGRVRGAPSPVVGGPGDRRKLPQRGPAATDFGAFHHFMCNFMRFHTSFSAFTSCLGRSMHHLC